MIDACIQAFRSFFELLRYGGIFSLMFLSVVLVMFGSLSGIWQKKDRGLQIVYRRPWLLRAGFSSFALMLILGPITLRAPLWLTCYWVIIGYPIASLLIYLSGPNDICLDIRSRTYQMCCGWPLFSRRFYGPLEDIAGVKVVKSCQDNSGRLLLLWKQQRKSRSNITLGQFPSITQANYEAQTLTKRLSVILLE